MINIMQQLKLWREERNILHAELDLKDSLLDEFREAMDELAANNIEDYVVEIVDIGIFCFNWLGVQDLTFFEKEITHFSPLELETRIKNINILHPIETHDALCTIIAICKVQCELKGYIFEKVVLEKIKTISSRQQCPIQKEDWLSNGAKGKWLKWEQQPVNTIYKADYSKCKIGA